MKIQHLLLTALVLLAVLFGCSKDDNPVTPPVGGGSTTFVGTLAGDTESGRLALDIPAAKPLQAAGDTVNVSGSIFLSTGDTITLAGIYVRSTGYLYVTGEGYTLTGVIASGTLTGTYDGPNGPGGFAASSSGGTAVKVFCGTYTEDPPGSNSGALNMLIDGASVTIITGGNTFYGTITDTTVTIYVAGTSGTVLATGTVRETSADGTYATPEGEHGVWSAAPCN